MDDCINYGVNSTMYTTSGKVIDTVVEKNESILLSKP